LLVSSVVNGGVGGARVVASGLNLNDIVARAEGRGSNVMGALAHGVVIAQLVISIVSAGNNTGLGEPGPGGTDLATVATEGEAGGAIAAASGVGNREEFSVIALGRNAETIVEGLSGAMGPAGTAVGLVTNVVNSHFALRPVGAGVEVGGEVVVGDTAFLDGANNGPVGVDNGTHHAAELVGGGTTEAVLSSGLPGRVRVGVNNLSVLLGLERLFKAEGIDDAILVAKAETGARALGVAQFNVGAREAGPNAGFELGELIEKLLDLTLVSGGGMVHNLGAEGADKVGLSEEFVGLGGTGDSSDGSKSKGAHG